VLVSAVQQHRCLADVRACVLGACMWANSHTTRGRKRWGRGLTCQTLTKNLMCTLVEACDAGLTRTA
jgi:hypothetical protein